MGIAEDVPGMRFINSGEEVIAVADEISRFVLGELAVEEYLGSLRHA